MEKTKIVVRSKIGKKRVLVIPKKIAEITGIDEGTKVKISTEGSKIIIEPIIDAVWIALHKEKIAKITLKELEEESLEQQGKYIK
ncbi:MAG: AbrB/MazE/SpoVT family DNA-binding domain-containing protein [Candidatus Odinarchaeota archaeon]|nr:AbrB/MazE/SpoVT family DNA-binding domain-containing protein [Candidatus Odinarchaeota archaeon]